MCFGERARGDSNPRPSGPKPDALSRLRHGPTNGGCRPLYPRGPPTVTHCVVGCLQPTSRQRQPVQRLVAIPAGATVSGILASLDHTPHCACGRSVAPAGAHRSIRCRATPLLTYNNQYKRGSVYICMQRRGQTNVEYLLLVGGIILIALVVGYYAISATSHAFHELNSTP